MTRINTIDVGLLLDQHLLAEYKELPRIISYFKRSLKAPNGFKGIPNYYKLNTGHVKFFYNKRQYLEDRYEQLCGELISRGYSINKIVYDFQILNEMDQVPYTPSIEDCCINIERLLLRMSERLDFYTMFRQHISLEYYTKILSEKYMMDGAA